MFILPFVYCCALFLNSASPVCSDITDNQIYIFYDIFLSVSSMYDGFPLSEVYLASPRSYSELHCLGINIQMIF